MAKAIGTGSRQPDGHGRRRWACSGQRRRSARGTEFASRRDSRLLTPTLMRHDPVEGKFELEQQLDVEHRP